jgi:signal transduction histidine kinase
MDLPRPSPGSAVELSLRFSRPPTIRTSVYAGFALVFALWLLSGAGLVRGLSDLERRTVSINAAATQAEALLSGMAADLLLASVYLRDAVFDVSPGFYKEQLLEIRGRVDRSLTAYVPVADSAEEREQLRQLRAEIDDFWETVVPVLEWEPNRREASARAMLRLVVIPKREVIDRITRRVRELNQAAYQTQQAETAAVYAAMQRRVWQISGLALFISLLVAVVASHYAGRLEARIREQQVTEARNRRDLQRLSARLVQAQEDERRTIARELHDEVGQALTAIKMDLAVAERSVAGAKSEQALRDARQLTDRALAEVRDLSQLLHPSLLDDLGLPAAVERFVRSFSSRTGIRTDLLQDRMEDRLPSEVEICLYRIVQEALTNVARHSEATACRVYLQRLPHTVLLTVEDDGRGLPPEILAGESGRQGLGLLGVRERVAERNGTVQLDSVDGKGTRITVELPVN